MKFFFLVVLELEGFYVEGFLIIFVDNFFFFVFDWWIGLDEVSRSDVSFF